MDPITTAIVATLPALASDLIKSSVKESFRYSLLPFFPLDRVSVFTMKSFFFSFSQY